MNSLRIKYQEINYLLEILFEHEDKELIYTLYRKRKSLSGMHLNYSSRDRFADMDILRDIMIPLENKIGGKGVLDLCYGDGRRFNGKYCKFERPIYRPLQYALKDSIQVWWPPNSRSSVGWSCAHIEQVLKNKYKNKIKVSSMPLGTIINKINEKQLVDTEKIQRLYKINSIYRMTKHDYEYNEYMDEPESDMGSQRFNNLEALAMYFICRKVGVEILSEMPQY